jgi:hypothetical protein
MRTRTTLTLAAVLAAGVLLGRLTAPGQPSTALHGDGQRLLHRGHRHHGAAEDQLASGFG